MEDMDNILLDEDPNLKPLGKTWSTQYSSPLSGGTKLSKTLSTPTGKPMTREDEEKRLNDMRLSLQGERQQFQAKIYTTWLNNKLSEAPGTPKIEDIFTDLTDGKLLLQLLEVLIDKRLKPMKGNLRLHHLNNLTLVLNTLEQYKVKLIGISNQSINEGEKVPTLGLCWSIIYRFQVLEAIKGDGKAGDAEKALLKWFQECIEEYDDVKIESFNAKKWRNGYAICALVHAFKPSLFKYSDLSKMDDTGRWQFAIDTAHNNYGIQPLFSGKDFEKDAVDSRTLVLYVSSVYEKLKDKTPTNKRQGEEEEEIIEAVEASVDESSQLVVDNMYELMRQRSATIKLENESPILTPIKNPTTKELEKRYAELSNLRKHVDEIGMDDIKSELEMTLSVNTIPADEENNLNEQYKVVEDEYKTLKENVAAQQKTIQNGLISDLKDQLNKIQDLVDNLKVNEKKIAEKVDTETSVAILDSNEKLCEEMISNLMSMQPLVKYLNKSTNQILNDDTFPKNEQEILKEQSDDTKTEFDELLASLKKDKDRLNAKKVEYGDHIKSLEKAWLEKLENVHDWVTKTMEDLTANKNSKLTDENKVLEKLNEIKQWRTELEGNWTIYQNLGHEWNDELCDKLQNELYADMLSEVKDDFNALNKELADQKAKYNKSHKELCDTRILNTWKKFFNSKMEGVLLFKQSIPSSPTDVNFDSAIKWKNELQTASEDLNNHNNTLNELTNEKQNITTNSKVSSKIKKIIDDDIEHMRALLDDHKKEMDLCKLKSLEMNESLSEKDGDTYKLWFNKYIETNQDIIEMTNVTDQLCKDCENAFIEEIVSHLTVVHDYDETIEEVLQYGDKLTAGNELSADKKDNVKDDCNVLNDTRKKLNESTKRLKKNLKARRLKEDEVSNSSMSDWRVKANDIDHLLQLTEGHEIFDSALPSSLKDLKKYQKDVDKVVSKYDSDEKVIDSNIAFGQDLIDNGKIKDGSFLDDVSIQLSGYNDRQNNIQDKLQQLQHRLAEHDDKLSSNADNTFDDWQDKYAMTNELMNKQKNTAEQLLNNDAHENELHDQLEAMLAVEDTIQETLDEGTQLANNDIFDDEKEEAVLNDCATLKDNLNEFKKTSNGLQNRLNDLKQSTMDSWNNQSNELRDFIKHQNATLKTINTEDDLDDAIRQIDIISNEIQAQEESIEAFENESESLMNDDKLLDDKSKVIIQDGYKTLLQDWSDLKEMVATLESRFHKKKIEEEGVSNQSINEWNEKAEKIEDWLTEAENEPILNEPKPTNFKELAHYQQELQNAIFKFNTEEKVIDGHLEFGQYLVDSGKIKDDNIVTKIKSQLSNYALREEEMHLKLKGLQDSLDNIQENLTMSETDLYEDWLKKYRETNENMISTSEEFDETLNNTNNTTITQMQIHELKEEVLKQIEEVEEVIEYGEGLSHGEVLSDMKKDQVKNDLQMLQDNLKSLKDSSKHLDERLEELKNSRLNDWSNQLLPLQQFIKTKTSDINEIDIGEDIDDAIQKIEIISKEIEAKEESVESFENESESLMSDDVLDTKSKSIVEDSYKSLVQDWNEVKGRCEIMNNRVHKKKLEEEGVSSDALKEWNERVTDIEDWLYDAENEPIFTSDVPSNLQKLTHYQQELKNLAFKLKTEEKVINEKLEYGKNLLKSGQIKDADKKNEVQQQIESYADRIKRLNKNLDDMEERCLSRNEELASNAQEKYNEWNDNFNDANDNLIDKHQHSVNYGEYLKANDLTKPVQKEISAHLESVDNLEELIVEIIENGTQFANSDVLSEDLKDTVKQQCGVLHDNLNKMKNSNKALQEKLDDLKNSGVKDWNSKLSSLQGFVRMKSNEINGIDMNKDVDTAIQAMQNVYNDIDGREEDVKDLKNESEVLLSSENSLVEKTKLSIKSNLSTFMEDWNALKDRKDAIQMSLQSKKNDEFEAGNNAMREWKEKAIKIATWLNESENNPILQSDQPENVQDLEKYSTDLENLIFKLTTEERIIDEQLDFGNHLSKSGKIKDEKQLESLKNQLADFTQRKKDLNEKLLKLGSKASDSLIAAHEVENNEYKAWMVAADKGKQHLSQFEETGKEVVIKTGKDADLIIDKQKEYLRELDEYESQIDNLLESGDDLIENQKLGARKSQEIKSESKIIQQRWSAIRNQAQVLLNRYEDIATMLNSESDEKADSLLTRIHLFHEWLQLGQQQLDFYKNPEKSITFNELLQREQGLKKLSSDLDSRSKEFSDLQRASANIKSKNDDQLSEKSQQVVDNMLEVEGQWGDIIDGIDAEFQNLYEMINNSLDKKRGGIDKSLKVIEAKLKEILECDFDKDTMIKCTKNLSEVTAELNKYSSPMKKLASQTVAVGDVTIFKDDEKDLMKQSFEDLLAQYKNCQSMAEKGKKRLRGDIHAYFKDQCDACNKKIKELDGQQITVHEDEEDLLVLKDYLQSYQEILNSTKVEHFQLGELEHFAEEVSTLGLLNADDQVKVAHHINDPLKNVEQLRQDCKSKMNRVYAVILHSLKIRQQNANQRLQKIDNVASNNSTDKTMQSFNNAINKLQSTKALEDELKATVDDIDQIKCETAALSEASVFEPSDIDKLQKRTSSLLNESMTSSETLGIHNKGVTKDIRALTIRKLDEFWGWLPIMQKRSKESSEIGPDLLTIKKQLQEMKVIAFQTQEKSFEPILLAENKEFLQRLPEEEQNEVKAAQKECQVIIDWQNERIKDLEEANDKWEEFNHNESDLLEYLRDNNSEVKIWNELDLNDVDSVENSKKSFTEIMGGLEMRKPYVQKLEDLTDDILKFLGNEGAVNNLKSRVADIHDAWNKTVKKSIENSSKLKKSRDQLEKLEDAVSDLRNWINETVEVVNDFNENKNEERVEKLREKIEVQNIEKGKMSALLQSINYWSDDLNNDEVTRSHFSIDDDVTALNYDFEDAIKLLDYFDTYRGKGFVIWRKVKQTMGDGAVRTKKAFERTPKENSENENGIQQGTGKELSNDELTFKENQIEPVIHNEIPSVLVTSEE